MQNGLQISENGIYNGKMYLSGTGQRNKGDKDKVIGNFIDGNIDPKNHFILEKEDIVYVEDMKLEDEVGDYGRKDLKLSG